MNLFRFLSFRPGNFRLEGSDRGFALTLLFPESVLGLIYPIRNDAIEITSPIRLDGRCAYEFQKRTGVGWCDMYLDRTSERYDARWSTRSGPNGANGNGLYFTIEREGGFVEASLHFSPESESQPFEFTNMRGERKLPRANVRGNLVDTTYVRGNLFDRIPPIFWLVFAAAGGQQGVVFDPRDFELDRGVEPSLAPWAWLTRQVMESFFDVFETQTHRGFTVWTGFVSYDQVLIDIQKLSNTDRTHVALDLAMLAQAVRMGEGAAWFRETQKAKDLSAGHNRALEDLQRLSPSNREDVALDLAALAQAIHVSEASAMFRGTADRRRLSSELAAAVARSIGVQQDTIDAVSPYPYLPTPIVLVPSVRTGLQKQIELDPVTRLIAASAYESDSRVRNDLARGLISDERDCVSNLMSHFRDFWGSRGTRCASFFAPARVLPPKEERLFGCDAAIVVKRNDTAWVCMFEAKWPRVTDKKYRWDSIVRGRSHFSDQLERQLKWSKHVAIWEHFFVELEVGYEFPSCDKWAATCVSQPAAIAFDLSCRDRDKAWAYRDLMGLFATSDLNGKHVGAMLVIPEKSELFETKRFFLVVREGPVRSS